MAKYFAKFPQVYYNFKFGDPESLVTNITSRFNFEEHFKNNTVAYYKYAVKDGDTPQDLAYKLYGSSEKHWIILLMNNIIDPEFDWPLDMNSFNKYVNDKYLPNVTSERTGVEWAQSHVHSYYKVVSITYDRNTRTETFEVDETQYHTIANESNVILLADGNSITEAISKTTKSYYDYEYELNEAKRHIKILKNEFLYAAQSEFENIFK